MALPLATFEKILQASSKNIRVSDTATAEFVEVIEGIAKQLAADAAELARHANRKTIVAEDIALAYKKRRQPML